MLDLTFFDRVSRSRQVHVKIILHETNNRIRFYHIAFIDLPDTDMKIKRESSEQPGFFPQQVHFHIMISTSQYIRPVHIPFGRVWKAV